MRVSALPAARGRTQRNHGYTGVTWSASWPSVCSSDFCIDCVPDSPLPRPVHLEGPSTPGRPSGNFYSVSTPLNSVLFLQLDSLAGPIVASALSAQPEGKDRTQSWILNSPAHCAPAVRQTSRLHRASTYDGNDSRRLVFCK